MSGDTLRVEWESLKAAERKLKQATREAERLGGRHGENLTHTLYKLGSFLDDGLCGAIRRLRDLESSIADANREERA
ncbi:MAG TPA: hypothetical protein VMB51_05310 [Solirubrobacteraceae bacterium]|nr:hypothetical protein [Solirubrobacteraceae bacterium]